MVGKQTEERMKVQMKMLEVAGFISASLLITLNNLISLGTASPSKANPVLLQATPLQLPGLGDNSPILPLSWCNIETMAPEPNSNTDPFPHPRPPAETRHRGTQRQQISYKTHTNILMNKNQPSKTIFLPIWKRLALTEASD